ncbi:hypothetical protein ACWGI8_05205 [Streptomyces sp. NPDC054841]
MALPIVRRLTSKFGHHVTAADFAQAEDGREDAFGVSDLLLEGAAAGSELPVSASLSILAAHGLGGLPHGKPFDQPGQVLEAHPSQLRVAEGGQAVRPCWHGVGGQEGPQGVDGQAIPHDLHDQRQEIPHPRGHDSPPGC